jgi:phage-related protein
MMEVFVWPVRPGLSKSLEPRKKRVQFGDGYSQRIKDGINTQLRKHSLVVRCRPAAMADDVEDFLTRHDGVTAFLWTPPDDYRQGKWICERWRRITHKLYAEVSMEFEEVPA